MKRKLCVKNVNDTIAAVFRERIIHRVSGIENVDLLEFTSNMLDAFNEKWGI